MATSPAPLCPVRVHFRHGQHEELSIRLQATELTAWRWATPEEALPLLKPDVATALTTTSLATAVYLEF